MAFQGRHQTRSGLHKINSVLLEGKGEDGGGSRGVWRGLIYKHHCPARSLSHSHGSAGSGSLLYTSHGAIRWGRSIRSLILGSRFCGESTGAVPALSPAVLAGPQGLTALQTRTRVTDASRQCPWPVGGQWLSWRSQAARCASTIWPSWWSSLSAGQRRGVFLVCLSSCTPGVVGESHHHYASRNLTGDGGKVNNSNFWGTEVFLGFTLLFVKCQWECQAFCSQGLKAIAY